MNGAFVASEVYERLALDMLAVEARDFAEVKDAMRKIIASAPDQVDVAFLLSSALAHAGDPTLRSEAPALPSREPGTRLPTHRRIVVSPGC